MEADLSSAIARELEALRRGAAAIPNAGQLLAAFARERRADPCLMLLYPRATSKQRRAAARRIAAAQPAIAFKQPDVRKALRGLSTAARDRWLRPLFAEALLEAAKESRTPLDRIRLGRKWVKDRHGRVLGPLAPLDLQLPTARRWLLQRAWRLTAQSILGGDEASGGRRLSRRDRKALGEDSRGVEAMHEYRPTPPADLRKARPSKRERQVYDLLRAGVTPAAAAERLKLSPSTVRVHLHRLRAKGTKM